MIVDDGSEDDTASIIEEFTVNNDYIELVRTHQAMKKELAVPRWSGHFTPVMILFARRILIL